MKKILCYGDSNTYGYDPRGFLGMRYPAEVRWTTILRGLLDGKYAILEEGMNGRPLPRFPYDEAFLNDLARGLSKGDLFIMMLGTNDILLTSHPDADAAVSRMEQFLQWRGRGNFSCEFMVLGPAYVSDEDAELATYHKESRRMNAGFESLCRTYSIPYHNVGDWGIPLSYDGVHFSEDGHRVFAERLAGILLHDEGD